ncbi:hypothetical protein Sj15T_02910 [Sphingobium sp. TA15]|uniref:Uncharacterized protein n=1 Tax=Sphingobium indicum (strain DSM 16413 / CCM 7287 / MTCC 6362 / UT26 / NBRC 101211 / UT26S) TaxID=452662 RepID=D4Z025_SPHIU|nr:hypothetical protein [Sphingobium indicum]BAI95957.1 hypothetical protein SJA_C1-11230 [Sphingobium indicum UT26S]BDD65270.1 hypothetical protein Sj15T_02910 [Sphingobium sp. TA15]
MHKEEEDGRVVTHVSRQEARSGASTHVTRYVLSISLALVVIAFAILLAGGFFNTAGTGADESHQASPAEAGGN